MNNGGSKSKTRFEYSISYPPVKRKGLTGNHRFLEGSHEAETVLLKIHS
jgi:hypothetical protein